jgi:hypothetical protein
MLAPMLSDSPVSSGDLQDRQMGTPLVWLIVGGPNVLLVAVAPHGPP